MAHCTKCGTEIPVNAQFCANCGQPQGVAAAQPGPGGPPAWQPAAGAATHSGLSENAAACLSYALGWLTGIIFFLIDKRPYVRFHAAQSIVTFGALHLIRIVLAMIFGVGLWWGNYGAAGWGSFGIGILLISLIGIASFVLWIVCMVQAYQGKKFVLPITGPIAENMAGR